MTKKRKVHSASDIKFYYNVSQYKRLDDLRSSLDMDITDFQLLLALYGLKNGNRIPIDKKDDTGDEHTFSRVVYNRSEVESDSNFGLVTILANLNGDYNEVMNTMAFEKMYKNDLPYSRLPNVLTFYEYLIGGIEYLYNTVFEIGNTESNIAIALYDVLLEEDGIIQELLVNMLLDEDENA